MEENYLTYVLIALLFAKEPLYAFLSKKFGMSFNGRDKRNSEREEREGDFHVDISRELGGINEKLTAIPEIEIEVRRLADHVNIQNGRISKLEGKLNG